MHEVRNVTSYCYFFGERSEAENFLGDHAHFWVVDHAKIPLTPSTRHFLSPYTAAVDKINILHDCKHKMGYKQHSVAYDHTTLNTPVLVRSPKLSSVGPAQYLDGWPPRNSRCCRLFLFFCSFFSLPACVLHGRIHGQWCLLVYTGMAAFCKDMSLCVSDIPF